MPDSESGEVKKKAKQKNKEGNEGKRKVETEKQKTLDDDETSDEGVIDRTPIKKSRTSEGFEKNAEGDEMLPLGKMRYVTVRSFKGKVLIDIREYYNDKSDGKTKPGKKGISLSREQYDELKRLTAEIDKRVEAA
uniref:PC4 domain-containing protein n=1 Tax=Syphacia muris TaxID=451379 RepID=A0A0N5AMG0_9BILA